MVTQKRIDDIKEVKKTINKILHQVGQNSIKWLDKKKSLSMFTASWTKEEYKFLLEIKHSKPQ